MPCGRRSTCSPILPARTPLWRRCFANSATTREPQLNPKWVLKLEKRSLLIRLLLSNFSTHFGFNCGSLVVAELAKHRRQSGVRAGKIGLQVDRLPQGIRRLG